MSSNRIYLSLCLLIAVIPFAVMTPALTGDFVLDDGFNILQNRLLYIETLNIDDLLNAALSFHDGNGGRPLPMLSFALDYWRAGSMDPFIFKTTNLVIHALTCFFLALFLRRLLILADWRAQQASLAALLFSLAWAIHPLQVSSVMYVVQRMQTMETLFLVLALWSYLAMRQIQIDGTGRGRPQGILVIVFWILALACKEDAPILFAFLLALELTILRFRAADKQIQNGIRHSYLLFSVLGLAAYIFIVIPHYWSWEAYPGRDFSSSERLLTQARVLVMHLGQILFPYPDHMTFIYDTLPVSRSLLQPWTTLASIVLIMALLAWAWVWRARRPLFSFGILFFFSGHFITSNVIPLELVFEHRNHLPLLGILLALGDLLLLASRQLAVNASITATALLGGFVLLSSMTVTHAHTWGDPVRHGEKLVRLLPDSTRAWTQLSGAHFDRYKATSDNVHLVNAIEVNQRGLQQINSTSLASNLVIYKSLLGTVTAEDWDNFLRALSSAPHGWQNKQVIWTMMNNVERGFTIDAGRVADAIEILPSKAGLHTDETLRLAVFLYKNVNQERSLQFFIRFAERSAADSPTLIRIISELEAAGHNEWATRLKEIQKNKSV